MDDQSTQRKLLWGGAIILILVYALIPVVWILSLSFKSPATIGDGRFLPSEWTWDNYDTVFSTGFFNAALRNSIGIALITTLLALAFASMAAYAITRLDFPGKNIILAGALAVSMFPQISIVTPIYQVMIRLHLIDTYRGLSGVYIGLALPLMVYVLWGHFRAIPASIDEAARIDGAGPLRMLWSVIVPLSLPGMVPAALLGFIASWNELMLALSLTTTPAHQTIPVGIANFTSLYSIPWGDMAAASVVVTLPLVVLVLIFQKRIVEGVTAGSVKG
jgi:multiple sugar transport system permease protein